MTASLLMAPTSGCSASAIDFAGIFRSSGGGSSFGGSNFGSGVFTTGTVIFSLPGSSALRGGSGLLLPPPPPPPPGPGSDSHTMSLELTSGVVSMAWAVGT